VQPPPAAVRSRFGLLPLRDEVITVEHVRKLIDGNGM
jgi:hypothetical protein